ncbi:MAG: TetR/AcrR family transcriptional regulator [Polyangiaceae bacterium]|nr:TetR/AcrR family transcriptional regulator [Polyangiaceae bacterium]MCE7889536.1 TetR/AcrR family transcriptional regulator [Sorangiineae bacterium PRO1]
MTTSAAIPLEVNDGVRQRILAAARAEFASRGFGAASVRTIAERAGATAAMINYYFGGKQALYDTVVAEAQGRLLARLSAAVGSGERDGLPVRLALAYFDFLVEERELQRLLLRQMLDRGDDLREHADDIAGPLAALLERHFGDRAVARQFAISVFGAIAGYFVYEPVLGAVLGRDPMSAESVAARRRHVEELVSLIERFAP